MHHLYWLVPQTAFIHVQIFMVKPKFHSHSMLQKVVEYFSDVSTPMQKYLIEWTLENKAIKHFFEILTEDMVVVVQECKNLSLW